MIDMTTVAVSLIGSSMTASLAYIVNKRAHDIRVIEADVNLRRELLAEVNKYAADIIELRRKLNDALSANDGLAELLNKQSSRIVDLEKKHVDRDTQVHLLESQVLNLQAANTALISQIGSLQLSNTDLQVKIKELQHVS